MKKRRQHLNHWRPGRLKFDQPHHIPLAVEGVADDEGIQYVRPPSSASTIPGARRRRLPAGPQELLFKQGMRAGEEVVLGDFHTFTEELDLALEKTGEARAPQRLQRPARGAVDPRADSAGGPRGPQFPLDAQLVDAMWVAASNAAISALPPLPNVFESQGAAFDATYKRSFLKQRLRDSLRETVAARCASDEFQTRLRLMQRRQTAAAAARGLTADSTAQYALQELVTRVAGAEVSFLPEQQAREGGSGSGCEYESASCGPAARAGAARGGQRTAPDSGHPPPPGAAGGHAARVRGALPARGRAAGCAGRPQRVRDGEPGYFCGARQQAGDALHSGAASGLQRARGLGGPGRHRVRAGGAGGGVAGRDGA